MMLAYHKNIVKGSYIDLYGAKKIYIRIDGSYYFGVINDSKYVIISSGKIIEFPIIDGKSPSKMLLQGGDGSHIYVEIYELGGVPSDDYGKEV